MSKGAAGRGVQKQNYITVQHQFLLMEALKENFERGWKSVIAPNKYSYNINSVIPKEQLIENHLIERLDFQVVNDEGKNISAVIIRQKNADIKDAVLYLHGNGGTKIQILGVLPFIVQHGIALISFDFVGCGNSDPGYLTYGMNQSSDAELVLRQAYKLISIDRLTVWGRSMGAVSAINFAVKNPKIVDKLVLDSPFRFLDEVIKRVIKTQTSLPQPFVSLVSYFLKKEIQERLKFPLFAQDYLQLFKKVSKSISVMFLCSENDTIVPKEQVQKFYKAYKGDRQMLQITESHEQDRGPRVYQQVVRWIRKIKNRKNMKLRIYKPCEIYCCENEQVYSMC